MTKSEKSKIFVVDDEVAICEALKRELKADFDVYTFTNPVFCLRKIKKTNCDLLITDVKMPQMDGIAFLSEARQTQPAIPVLIITGYGDIPMAVKAFKAGAIDFIEKPFSRELLLSAINEILKKKSNGKENIAFAEKLSQTELKILKLILDGKSNKQIAFIMSRSRRTIEDHRSRIMKKLSADNIVELTKRGIQLGLTNLNIK